VILDPSARWGCSFRGLVTDQQTPDYESRASCKRPGLGAAFVGLALALCLLPSTLAAQGRAGEALATRYATRFRCDTATTLEATRPQIPRSPLGSAKACWVLASLGVPTREQEPAWGEEGRDPQELLQLVERLLLHAQDCVDPNNLPLDFWSEHYVSRNR
jgi:hypothetical protein